MGEARSHQATSSGPTPDRERATAGPDGGRLVWMDQLRGLAILLVVAFHGRTVLARFTSDVPAGLAEFTAFFAPFRMPLLIFLSGMLLGRSLGKPSRTYFLGKARGIGWPYLVWSVGFLLVAGRASADHLVAVLWSPPPYLWYLTYLLAYYAMVWVLRALRVPLVAVVPVALLTSAVDGAGLGRFAFLFAFFAAGHVYLQNSHRVGLGARRGWLWGSGVVVVVGGLASAAGLDLKYEPLFVLVPAAGIALCLLLAPQQGVGPVTRALSCVGRESLVFYVSHFVTLWAVYSWSTAAGFEEPVPVYLLGVCSALAVGTCLAWARRRSPVVQALFRLPDLPALGRSSSARRVRWAVDLSRLPGSSPGWPSTSRGRTARPAPRRAAPTVAGRTSQ